MRELPESVKVGDVFAIRVRWKCVIDCGSGTDQRGAQTFDGGFESADALLGRWGEEVDVHDIASR